MDKTFPVNQVPRQEEQPRSKSYDAEMSITDVGTAEPFGRFIPPHQMNGDNFALGSSEDSQNFNRTRVFNWKSTGTNQPRNTGMQMSPSEPAQLGITRVTQTSPKKVSQAGGTQTTPSLSPKRSTSTGGTQTTPTKQDTGPRSPGSTRSQSHQRGSTGPQSSIQGEEKQEEINI